MADQKAQTTKYKAFISYSRKNKEFVQKLNDGLDFNGVPAWVDWEGIPLSSEWREEIRQAIISTDVFIFVISPESCASEECGKEVAVALEYKKKLVPVLYRMPGKDDAQPHQKIRDINYTMMREGEDDFGATLPKLIEAINTDLEWVEQNSRYLERAVAWQAKNADSSILLRGSELEEAEHWRVQAASESHREIAPIQNEYIDASRKAVSAGQRKVFIGVLIALAISVGLAILAGVLFVRATQSEYVARQNAETAVAAQSTALFNEDRAKTEEAKAQISYATAVAAQATAVANEKLAQDNEKLAKEKESLAKTQRSAAQAQILQSRPGELDVSTLLAIDAFNRDPNFLQAEAILRQNISLLPRPIGQVDLAQHIGSVNFSPDGTQFISADWNGYACLWETASVQKLACFEHAHWVIDAFFINATQVVTAAGQDVFVREALTGKTVFTYTAPAQITAVAVSPDGTWLAVGTVSNSNNNELLIVNLKTKKFWVSFEEQGDITRLEFSIDSRRLAIGTSEGRLNIWLAQGTTQQSGPSHRDAIIDLAFSPDGKFIAAGGKDSWMRVSFTADPITLHYPKLLKDWVEDLVFSPDGRFLVAASDDFNVYVWDALSGTEIHKLAHQTFATKVAISPNSQWVASTSYDRTVRVWNLATGDLMREMPLDSFGSALAFSPDGNYLLVGEDGGKLSAWDLRSLDVRVGYLEFSELVNEALFSPDSKWLIVNTDDQKVWQLPANDWQSNSKGNKNGQALFTADDLTTHLAISPDARWLAANTNRTLYIYNFIKKNRIPIENAADDRSMLAFSPDNQRLAISTGTSVSLRDLTEPQSAQTFIPEEDVPVNALAFSMDGDLLALGLSDKIILWNVAGQNPAGELEHPGNIIALAFSHDGNWLATTSDNGTTFFWRWQNGVFTWRYAFTQDGQANMLSFSPDDKLLAIAGKEGALYLVQASTGEEYARLQNSVAVTSVSFTSDGKYLATVSGKVVQIWRVDSLEVVPKRLIPQIACSRLLTNLNEAQWQAFFPGDHYTPICPELPGHEK